MKFTKIPCYKLSWAEVGEIMAEEVSAILGRTVPCSAKSEDTSYWGCSFADPISLTELCMILQSVHATKEEWEDALPDEGDITIHDMGWNLGEKLLRRNLGVFWECRYIAEDALYLLGVQDAPASDMDIVDVGGTKVCFADLKSKHELFNFFEEGACDHATLMEFCEDYKKRYNNDLCWPYPLGVDNHLGLMLVLVKEGVLALPYDGFDAGNYEFFTLKDAHLLTSDEITGLGDRWERFSDGLLSAVSDMAFYMHKREVAGI